MSVIYLAHPIDFANDENRRRIDTTVNAICDRFAARGASAVFRPAQAWKASPPFDPRVQMMNQQMMVECDAVVIYHPVGVPSIGVPVEMSLALGKKPMIVIRGEEGYAPELESVVLSAVAAAVPFYTENEIDRAIDELLTVLEIMQRSEAVEQDTRAVARYSGPGAAPSLAHDDDAGFDLTYHGTDVIGIEPGGFAMVPSGVSIQLPESLWAMITGRSSSFKKGLLVPVSIIDAGFRGELFAVCRNISDTPIFIEPGDRIAQVVPMPLLAPHIRWEHGTLDQTERGESGFGSTGR